jgi:murein DD-endopeptidase MepM/ murein hydrolase activator NlpD
VVRRFPRDRLTRDTISGWRLHRRRLSALIVLLALVASLLSLQTVTALGAGEDDLKDRQTEVDQSLEEARGDLGHSSAQLVAAVEALQEAQQQLSSAQAHLDQTRVELAAAIEHDQEMRAKLEEAVLRLQTARAQLARGRERVEQQRDEVARWAASTFQTGDDKLLGLRVLLTAQNPETLTTQMDAVDSVSAKNANRFDRLQASEVLLEVNEDEVEAARDEVALQREAAARNLVLKRSLEAQAEAARQAVASLVEERAAAKAAAEEAKAEDRRQIAALESERSRIESELAAIAAAREAERLRQQQAAAASGSSLSGSGFLAYPVDSYITSPYGMRFHPILLYWKLHDGTDFGAACGTAVRAADDGVVLSTYYNGGYGNRVILDHGVERGESLSTSYNHLSAYSTYAGERVARGEIVGYVGTTGYSTGCHLHFMVYENGATVDPMNWL